MLDQLNDQSAETHQQDARLAGCLDTVRRSTQCRPARQQVTASLRVVVGPRYAARPRWRDRLSQTVGCVNRLFENAGIRWELGESSTWQPRFQGHNLSALLGQLEHDVPQGSGALLGMIVGEERRMYGQIGGSVGLTRGSTGIISSWKRPENDCLAAAQSLGFMLGATHSRGKGWVMTTKLHRFALPSPDPYSKVVRNYRFHPRNVAVIRTFRFARFEGRALLLPPSCRQRVAGLTNCYAQAAEEARTGRRRADLAALDQISESTAGDACAEQLRAAQRASAAPKQEAFAAARRLAAVLRVLRRRSDVARASLDRCQNGTSILLRQLAGRWGNQLIDSNDRAAGRLARQLFEDYLSLFPHGAHIYNTTYHLALVLDRLGAHELAFARYYQLLKARPPGQHHQKALDAAMRTGWIWYNNSRQTSSQRLWRAAEPLPEKHARLLEVLELSSRSGDSRPQLVLTATFGLASLLDNHGRYARSIPLFERVARLHADAAIADLAARSVINSLLKARRFDDLLTAAARLGKLGRLMKGDFALYLTEYKREALLRKLGPGARLSSDAQSVNRSACAAGDPRACNNLGVAYQTGAGVRRDMRRAIKLFKKACDLRDTKSPKSKRRRGWQGCGNLAGAYLRGAGVPRDTRRALQLARLACFKADHCNTLGAMALQGIEVRKDAEAALLLFRKACGVEIPEACTNAGNVALNHVRPPKYALALQVLKRGCRLGHGESCRLISVMYMKPMGVAKDFNSFARYFAKACSLGLAAKYKSVCDNFFKHFPQLRQPRP